MLLLFRTRGQAWGIHGFATSEFIGYAATKSIVNWAFNSVQLHQRCQLLDNVSSTGRILSFSTAFHWNSSLVRLLLCLFTHTQAPLSLLRDFDAPDVAGRPSDTSSAMIAASGMLMLSRFEQGASNATGANYWANAAVRVSAKLNPTTSTLLILTML